MSVGEGGEVAALLGLDIDSAMNTITTLLVQQSSRGTPVYAKPVVQLGLKIHNSWSTLVY